MRFGEVSDHRDVMYQIQSLLLHIRGTILNVPFLAINPLLLHSPHPTSFPILFTNNNISTSSSSYSSLPFPPFLVAFLICLVPLYLFLLPLILN